MKQDNTKEVTAETLVIVHIVRASFTWMTNLLQRSRWKALTVSPDFLKGCKTHALNYILAENYERELYYLDCERINFYSEKGERIWATSGSGQMNSPGLPVNVSVYIIRGRVRTA